MNDDLALWWSWWYFADVDAQQRADLAQAVAEFMASQS